MHKSSHEELIRRFEDPKRDEWQEPQKVLALMRPLSGIKLIDIGSGGGYFTKYFIREGAQTVAADVDKKFLDFVRSRFEKNKNFSSRLIEYTDPKMGQAQFDVAFNCNTYHHIENRVEYFKKVYAGLKPAGRLAIVDFAPLRGQPRQFGPPDSMCIDEKVVQEELMAAGFKIMTVHTQTLKYQYIIIATK
jgi:predicted methyltransferase